MFGHYTPTISGDPGESRSRAPRQIRLKIGSGGMCLHRISPGSLTKFGQDPPKPTMVGV